MGLLGSFFGNDQRDDLAAANAQSNAALKKGYKDARSDYTTAENYFAPFAQQGQQANTFYNDALGLNGDPARDTAVGTLTSNPLFSGQLANDSNAVSRMLNAQGSGRGLEALAGQRVFQQTAGNWLDRYRDQGAQGLNATNAMAGYRAGRGDLAYGYGASKAGNAINYGNAVAGSRNIGINNLLNVAGLAVNALKPTPKVG